MASNVRTCSLITAPFATSPEEITFASCQNMTERLSRLSFPNRNEKLRYKKKRASDIVGNNSKIIYRKPSGLIAPSSLSRNSTTSDSISANNTETTFDPEGTILIFDWDDTLCPSTWLSNNSMTLNDICRVPPDFESLLSKMALCSRKTLEIAAKLGTVIIVTNAEQGWIELSCRKFLPSLYTYLSEFKQLSARTMYESINSNDPFTWKQLAFKNEIYSHFSCTRAEKKNVISLGDSAHERQAIIAVTRSLNAIHSDTQSGSLAWAELPPDPEFIRILGHCRTKSVKFIERPNIDELMKEHELICRLLEKVVYLDEDLDLCIKGSIHYNEAFLPT